MKIVLACITALLMTAAAVAQTTVQVPSQVVSVPVPAQTITVPARTVTVTVPASTITVPASNILYTVPAYLLTVPPVIPPPTCPPLPAPLTQSASCPAGSTGSYQQTATYSLAAYPTCGVLGAYTPTSPPAGACTAILPPPPVASNCGNMLGGAVTFCETFDAPAGIAGTRAGDLNPNVWGVSRQIASGTNFGQGQYNMWNATQIVMCDGTTPTVNAPSDIVICNGQLREASDDNNDGGFDDGTVTSLAMYPKQPFDFAGRTGTVSFDVSNDAGPHGAWPEFWLSDTPAPDPFNHFDSWQSVTANGIGIRFDNVAPIGQGGECGNNNNLTKLRVTVDSAAVVRNYVLDDTLGYGPGIVKMQPLDCVIESTGPGQFNHFELRISASQIDVYGTDAGVAATTATLRHIAVITNVGATFTRGLIWLEDVHYNGDKILDPTRASQRVHTFSWDNVAFDGPFTDRDFSYDAPDNTLKGTNGAFSLGKFASANQYTTWSVPNVPANPNPGAVKVLFNFNNSNMGTNPTVLNVKLNGVLTTMPWPYPDESITTPRTIAVVVPVTALVAGTNTIQLGADQPEAFYNVDLVLGDVPGGVPVLPGSVQTFP